jgi:triosephosphate isomerase
LSLKTPVVILNFKTYLESSGEKALDLANALESAGEESGITMVAVPQAIDIYRIKEETNIPVLSQHIDAVSPGGHTGSNLFESFVASGIDGTLLNHSECRMTLADIAEVVKKTKEAELISCVCTNNIETSVAAATFSPDYVAVEPPELIGNNALKEFPGSRCPARTLADRRHPGLFQDVPAGKQECRTYGE